MRMGDAFEICGFLQLRRGEEGRGAGVTICGGRLVYIRFVFVYVFVFVVLAW